MIPEEELINRKSLNLAPMVDFLFLLLAVFAVLAVTRTALYDSEIKLVKMDTLMPPPSLEDPSYGHTILLSISDKGQYKWVTEFNEFLLENVESITQEILKQQRAGLLPKEKEKTKVLLYIDKSAPWESIAKIIFTIKEAGFQISPVYSPET